MLERPPRHGRAARSWLGAVLTNRLRNDARAQGRRARREEAVGEEALAEPPGSPEEMTVRLQAASMLAGVIARLTFIQVAQVDWDKAHRK